ncbi:MAG TPA: 5-(carboxyamino)imidazole ribonucleotide synthase [Candidatus Saccharimonadales bacterium]
MNKTIGIIGGGQLGRMLTLAAKPLGFDVVVVDPGENCPAVQVGAQQIKGELYDETALRELAKQSSVITIEIEHLNAAILAEIEAEGTPVHPKPVTIQMIQDKLEQKKFLQTREIPVADFYEISDEASAFRALEEFGGAMLLKTRHGAYDGRGNAKVTSSEELKSALVSFEGRKLYGERLVPFVKEVAVMVAKDVEGNVKLYPLTETVHERNICIETLTPAPVASEIEAKAEKVARDVANLLEGAGVFGVEMFVDENGEILVNEIAPRVHNSGHYTMNGSVTSQFEQHIRAITGLPLGSTDLTAPAVVMHNILGERDGTTEVKGLENALQPGGISIHLYGKTPTKIDRKMGHINAVADSLEVASENVRNARKNFDI